MELDAITPQLIKRALTSWQQSDILPDALLELDFLTGQQARSKIEKQIAFHDWLHNVVWEKLCTFRRQEGLPVGENAATSSLLIWDIVARDFSTNNVQLEAWSALFHRYFVPHSLTFSELAALIPVDPRQFRRRINLGLNYLTDLTRRTEQEAHLNHRYSLLSRFLPPPDYVALFGVDVMLEDIMDQIQHSRGHSVLVLEGIGGTGKTALARSTAHQLARIATFTNIAWVSARQQWLSERGEILTSEPAADSLDNILTRLSGQLGHEHLAGLSAEDKIAQLKQFIHHTPCLIVIDNLETFAEIEMLLPFLEPPHGDSRFLLTSRHSVANLPYVQRFKVPPLSFSASQALVHSELKRHGRQTSLAIEVMNQIYDLIGGLPLALKLATAQMSFLPVDEILHELRLATQETTGNLYRFIYHRSWQLLTDAAKAQLLAMLAVSPEGEDIHWLRMMGSLPAGEFNQALAQLQDTSLLEVAGPPERPIYRIHRLTATFLQTDVLLLWHREEQDAGL